MPALGAGPLARVFALLYVLFHKQKSQGATNQSVRAKKAEQLRPQSQPHRETPVCGAILQGPVPPLHTDPIRAAICRVDTQRMAAP